MNTRLKPPIEIVMCAPRGFCAGVDRAIQIVELTLERYGAPVYVRHEIVHNRFVVDDLKSKGAIFVEELDDIPDTKQPVIFSAHGVAKAIPEAAAARNLLQIDATCPLVTKVHREAEIHHRRGRDIILIGHAGHPEVDGTIGQLPTGVMSLVQNIGEANAFTPKRPDALAYVTQTTLSVSDTAEIVAVLKARFPDIVGPHREDICYATTNRQEAVRQVARDVDAVLVVGAPNSSNSQRLREVAEQEGCKVALLVQSAHDIDWGQFEGVAAVGITAGASAPEKLVEDVVDAFGARFDTTISLVKTADEPIVFGLPRELRAG
ncbi:MAG: 4-hydroxy-3-methylbut-2-enyl diphosphate reductase [Alphaproteobacteria bacterium]